MEPADQDPHLGVKPVDPSAEAGVFVDWESVKKTAEDLKGKTQVAARQAGKVFLGKYVVVRGALRDLHPNEGGRTLTIDVGNDLFGVAAHFHPEWNVHLDHRTTGSAVAVVARIGSLTWLDVELVDCALEGVPPPLREKVVAEKPAKTDAARPDPPLWMLMTALQRFPDGVRALRDGREKKPGKGLRPRPEYPLDDEYDIQDALWLYIKMAFADARREDPTPNAAGSSSKIDYSIPALAAGIEVKVARPGVDVPKLKSDLVTDIHDVGKRPDIRALVIFIAEAVRASGVTAPLADLNGTHGRLDVRVIRVQL